MNRPTNPRIPVVTDPTPETERFLKSLFPERDNPGNVFATMAHRPWLLKSFIGLGTQLIGRGAIDDRDREILILRVGWRCQSVYEFGQHTLVGLEIGLSQDEISALASDIDPAESDHAWSNSDTEIIRMVDELCADNCVTEATYTRLAERWNNDTLIDLIMCTGYYRMLSGFLNSFGVELDEGVPGFPVGTSTS